MKKKIAFIYDHRYYRIGKNYYSSGAFTSDVWDRFFPAFDTLTVYGSIIEKKEMMLLNNNIVNHDKVKFKNIQYINSLNTYLKNIRNVKNVLEKDYLDYDAVVIRLPGVVSYFAFQVAKKIQIPIALEVVGCPWDAYWNYGNFAGKIIAPLSYFLMKKMVKDADHVIYVTKDFLQNRYPTRGKQANASNVDVEVPGNSILHKKLSLIKNTNKKIKIGLMGSSNVKYKGHIELLKALNVIKNKIPEVTLEFVGPGNNDWIKNLAAKLEISDFIIFKGQLKSGRAVLEWLDQLNLYVHPSKQEGLPRSVIEAMSRCCPVLASSVGGIPELLQNQYMHHPGDFMVLSEHLDRCLNDTSEQVKMAKENYEKSMKYDRRLLIAERKKFWNNFSRDIFANSNK